MNRKLRPTAVFATVALFVSALVAGPVFADSSADLVKGVDVSNHQNTGGDNPIDWVAVKGDNQRFVYLKATEGTDWTDQSYAQFAQGAINQGFQVGAYHYARPAKDPVAQAQHFAEVVNAGPNTTLPPVLDIEVDEGLNAAELADWTRSFLAELEKGTGRTPMIYTYRFFWKEQMDNTAEFGNYPLWLAAWQNNAPRPVGGWDKVDIWQRPDSGKVPGINTPVDMNVFNGDPGQFARYSAGELNAAGGVLEQFQETELDSGISGSLAVLEQTNTGLTAAILGLASGLVDMPQLEDAAQRFGFDPKDAHNIADTVRIQVETGKLPIDELNTMMLGEGYSVGDLLILLHNANKQGPAAGK